MNGYTNKATEHQAREAQRLAVKHARETDKPMKSSAVLCANTAADLIREHKWGFAHEWARESLAYSVGIFHPDYQRLTAERSGEVAS